MGDGCTWGRAHDLFYLFICQIVVNTICTDEDTVTGINGDLCCMDCGWNRTANSLSNTTTIAEVVIFSVGKLISPHGLIDALGMIFIDDVIFYQFGEESIVVGETLQIFFTA